MYNSYTSTSVSYKNQMDTHLLLGRIVDGCQGDEAANMLSVFLKNDVIPEARDRNTCVKYCRHIYADRVTRGEVRRLPVRESLIVSAL